jgi:hypothetical protein
MSLLQFFILWSWKSMKEGQSDTLEFPTIDPILFKMLKEFIEDGTIVKECMIENENILSHLETVVELYLLANQYGYNALETFCIERMLSILTPTTFIEYFELANTTHDLNFLQRLRNYCLLVGNQSMVETLDPYTIFALFDNEAYLTD